LLAQGGILQQHCKRPTVGSQQQEHLHLDPSLSASEAPAMKEKSMAVDATNL
jgi:hypothetical protein